MENNNKPIVVKHQKIIEIIGFIVLALSLVISIALIITKEMFSLQLFPFIFALLGLFIIICYNKEYLTINENDIIYNKVVKEITYNVNDIDMIVLSQNESPTINITFINKENEKMFLLLSTLSGIEEALEYFDSKEVLIITAEDLIAEGNFEFLSCLPYADRSYYKKIIKKL